MVKDNPLKIKTIKITPALASEKYVDAPLIKTTLYSRHEL